MEQNTQAQGELGKVEHAHRPLGVIARAQQFQPRRRKLFGRFGFKITGKAFQLVSTGRFSTTPQGLNGFDLAHALLANALQRVFLALQHCGQGKDDQNDPHTTQRQQRASGAQGIDQRLVQGLKHGGAPLHFDIRHDLHVEDVDRQHDADKDACGHENRRVFDIDVIVRVNHVDRDQRAQGEPRQEHA